MDRRGQTCRIVLLLVAVCVGRAARAGTAEDEDHPPARHVRIAMAALVRAQALERRGAFDSALAAYHRVINEFANDDIRPQAIYIAARLHDRLHQSNEARALYEQLIDDHCKSQYACGAMFRLGRLLDQAGDRPAAIVHWQSIHDRGTDAPHWRESTFLLAEDAILRGDYARARALLPGLIEQFELDGSSTVDAVNASNHAGRSASSDNEIAARSLLLAAQLAMHEDDWQQARAYVARIVSNCPAGPICLLAEFWVAEADYRLNRFDEALGEFERLQPLLLGRSDSWVPIVPLRRAQILAHQNQWVEALEIAQGVVEEHPDFPLVYEAQYVLGRSHAALGEFDQARNAYENVIASPQGGASETAAMAQWMIGETYLHQRDYDAALRAYFRAETLYPYSQWQARSLFEAGKCYELLGEWRKAEATYRRLVDRFPEADVADEVRARLDVVVRQLADSNDRQWRQ